MLDIKTDREGSSWGISSTAAALHNEALVWDNHGCMPMSPRLNAETLPQLLRYRAAGVDVASINIGYGAVSLERHFELVRQMRTFIVERPEDYVLVTVADDIASAKRDGKLAVTFDIEGAAAIDHLGRVQEFYDLGVRWIGLAYNQTNRYAGGCHDADTGLPADGRALVEEMARVGMVTCLSHVGYRTVRDVLGLNIGPVVISHSNPRAVNDHPRNVPDDIIIGCAATGGVIGVNGLGLFLGGDDISADRLVAHIDYLVELVGPGHVGLGLDFVFDPNEMDDEKDSMGTIFPPGFGYEDPLTCFDIDHTPHITEALQKRGYSSHDIRLILGENWMRVAGAVWR